MTFNSNMHFAVTVSSNMHFAVTVSSNMHFAVTVSSNMHFAVTVSSNRVYGRFVTAAMVTADLRMFSKDEILDHTFFAAILRPLSTSGSVWRE